MPFLVCPRHGCERPVCSGSVVIQDAHYLHSSHDPEDPIEAPACWLRVQMAAERNRRAVLAPRP